MKRGGFQKCHYYMQCFIYTIFVYWYCTELLDLDSELGGIMNEARSKRNS